METTTKNANKSLLFAIIIASIFFLCCSCSTRKVNKSVTEIKETAKTETSTTDSSKTVTKTDINTKIIDSSSTEEFTIVPIDSTKEMVISGKSYFNAKIRLKKERKDKILTQSENIAKTVQNDIKTNSKSENSKQIKQVVKNTERKPSYFWLLWLLLLIPIYFLWKKYRGVIPF